MTPPQTLRTFGPTCTDQDVPRLMTQMEQIHAYLSTHQWSTLAEIEASTGFPQASISSQLRHLRKPRFGGFRVEKRRRTSGGTWEYTLSPRHDENA